MELKTIEIEVVNSPTILQRVIQIIKKRRINIQQFFAEEENAENGIIKMKVQADDEQVRLLKSQFEKQIDVIKIT